MAGNISHSFFDYDEFQTLCLSIHNINCVLFYSQLEKNTGYTPVVWRSIMKTAHNAEDMVKQRRVYYG